MISRIAESPRIQSGAEAMTAAWVMLLAPVSFGVSLVLLAAYTGGDQVHYHRLYASFKTASFFDIPELLRTIVSSVEYITGIILWLGAKSGIPKNIYIASLNVVLVLELFVLLRRYRVSWLSTGLLLSNYYLLVIMTAAERLKIAYIFLIMAMLLTGKIKKLIIVASPFAHLQSIIILAGMYSASLEKSIKQLLYRLRISKTDLLFLVAALLLGAVMFLVLFDGIWGKFSFYLKNEIRLSEFVQIVLLFVIAIFVTDNKFKLSLAFLPLFLAVSLFGGTQINMLAITVTLGILLVENKLNHPLIISLLAYMSFKSIFYINNILMYGDGFSGQTKILGWTF